MLLQRLHRAVGLTLGLAVAVAAVGCGSVVGDMRNEIQRGRYQAALDRGDRYIAEEPDGDERGAVLDQIVEARFRLACVSGVDELKRFAHAYRDSPWAVDAKKLLSRLVYEHGVRGSVAPEPYERYLAEYPDGYYAEEAARLSRERSWDQVRAKDTAGAYRGYLERFPDSPDSAWARERLSQLLWAEAERSGSPEAFAKLAQQFEAAGDADLAAKARAEAEERAEGERARNEAESFAAAEATGSVGAWLRHAMRFPGSETATTALERAVALVDGGGEIVIEPVVWHRARAVFPDSPITERLEKMAIAHAWAMAERDDTPEAYRSFRADFAASDRAVEAEFRAAILEWFGEPQHDDELSAVINLVYAPDTSDVQLLLQVHERNGKLVGGLLQPDFQVIENGREAKITGFAGMETNRPVDIVFMVDTSGSMSDKLVALRQSMAQFAEVLAFRQRDARFALVTFVKEVDGKTPFTSSASTFKKWAAKVPPGAGGVENPARAIATALRYPFRRDAQKVVVLVTDEDPEVAFDAGSGLTLAAAGDALLDKRVTTFIVAPDDAVYRDLERRSEGIFLQIPTGKNTARFGKQVLEIADLVSRQYFVRYRSPRPLRPGQRRVTKVRVQRPGVWAGAGGVGTGEVVDVLRGFGTDCEILVVAVDGALRYSSDCGETWEPVEAPLQGDRVVAAAAGRDGWVHLRTASGGVANIRLGSRGQVAEVATLTPSGATASASGLTPGEVYWVADGRLFASTASGKGQPVALTTGGARVIDVASDVGNGRLCVVLDDGVVLCRGDRSERWVRTGRLPVKSLSAGARLALDPWHEDTLYLAIPGEPILQSSSQGRHWRRLAAVRAPAALAGRAMSFGRDATSKRVCVTSEDGVLCSDDDGLSWSSPGVGGERLGKSNPIVVDSDAGMLLIGRTDGSLYKLRPIEDREFVSAQVYFASGVAEPKARLVPLLERVGVRLAGDPGLRIRVEGHTDADGDDAFNKGLSERRAAAVKRILVESGARDEQVVTFGYGESRPLRPNTTRANKQANRRVELIVYR